MAAIICHYSKRKLIHLYLESVQVCTESALIPTNFSEEDLTLACSSLTGLRVKDNCSGFEIFLPLIKCFKRVISY